MQNNLYNDKTQKNIIIQKDDCIVHNITNEEGTLIVTEYNVFSGVWLLYRDNHLHHCQNPEGYPSGLLEITYCREGRLEYNAGECFFYLSEGDMVVNKSISNANVYCPTKHHLGISVIIDPKLAPQSFSSILDNVEVNTNEILEKFCHDDNHFIMRSTSRIEHIFSELYSVPPTSRKGYVKVKILELLLFLKDLDINRSETQQHIHTASQVELVQQVCEFIGEHMDIRPTIEQLAARFYVSPAQLKKCFYDVYGESIYSHAKSYKMKSAAYELRTTTHTISEIAHSFGYDNSSKFSQAFRKVMGMSPTEYRKEMKNSKNNKIT